MPSLTRVLRAPTYKNTGSVARDHLASERTLLSWLRTGLGFVALGIGVERFSRLETSESAHHISAQPASSAARFRQNTLGSSEHFLVVALLSSGTGSIVYGTARYFSNMRLLEKGLFKPAFLGAGALGFAVVGLAGAACWGTLSDVQKTTPEKD